MEGSRGEKTSLILKRDLPTLSYSAKFSMRYVVATFGRDRDRCSEIEDVTIPYSNFSQSIKDSWFVSFSTLVLTKSLTPLYRGDSEIWAR
jgi:hypothetical protein